MGGEKEGKEECANMRNGGGRRGEGRRAEEGGRREEGGGRREEGGGRREEEGGRREEGGGRREERGEIVPKTVSLVTLISFCRSALPKTFSSTTLPF
jgi:ATP-dependent RNA helicase DHX57